MRNWHDDVPQSQNTSSNLQLSAAIKQWHTINLCSFISQADTLIPCSSSFLRQSSLKIHIFRGRCLYILIYFIYFFKASNSNSLFSYAICIFPTTQSFIGCPVMSQLIHGVIWFIYQNLRNRNTIT